MREEQITGRGRRDDVDLGFVAFRQQFRNGPQRRRLGIELSHTDAVRVLEDPASLHAEYAAWLERTGRPAHADQAEADARQPWFRRSWRRS